MFVVGGVANGVASVSMRSLIHHRVPDELRGRVFAAYFGVAFAGQLAATALGGVLIAILPSSQDVLLIGGVGGVVVGLIGLAWYAALPSEARAPTVVHRAGNRAGRTGYGGGSRHHAVRHDLARRCGRGTDGGLPSVQPSA